MSEEFIKDEQTALERYFEAIREINTFYDKELITEDILSDLSETEIVELINSAVSPDHSDKPEPVFMADASTYLEASIELCEKNIERLTAENIDDSYNARHIYVVIKSLFVAGIFGLTNILSVSIFSGSLAYLYFAKKEISHQKEDIHSRRISEWAMTNLTSKLKVLKDLRANL